MAPMRELTYAILVKKEAEEEEKDDGKRLRRNQSWYQSAQSWPFEHFQPASEANDTMKGSSELRCWSILRSRQDSWHK